MSSPIKSINRIYTATFWITTFEPMHKNLIPTLSGGHAKPNGSSIYRNIYLIINAKLKSQKVSIIHIHTYKQMHVALKAGYANLCWNTHTHDLHMHMHMYTNIAPCTHIRTLIIHLCFETCSQVSQMICSCSPSLHGLRITVRKSVKLSDWPYCNNTSDFSMLAA